MLPRAAMVEVVRGELRVDRAAFRWPLRSSAQHRLWLGELPCRGFARAPPAGNLCSLRVFVCDPCGQQGVWTG